MTRLVDKIESVMRGVNPFNYAPHDGGNYYYEANNMIKLLPYFEVGDSMLDLCMDAFQIHNTGYPIWDQIAQNIEPLVLQHKSKLRTHRIQDELMMRVSIST
jgi:hypothetical protein